MPRFDEILIHPADMQKILEALAGHPWSQGEIIIRDMGNEFVIRDPLENHITTVKKMEDQGS